MQYFYTERLQVRQSKTDKASGAGQVNIARRPPLAIGHAETGV